jgi:dTDP-4-dehydrorhamnose reductase
MILVLGGMGYVGQAFQRYLVSQSIEFDVVSRASLDYSNVAELTTFLETRRPGFLINAAGYTGRPNVDACEVAKSECLAGNALLPGTIRAACEATGTSWGHVSSGCIFTGAKADGSGFTESDAPNFSFRQNNCSFYSGCKAIGEELLEGAENCFVWRLRIPFDANDSPRNYISKMMRYDRLLAAQNSLSQLDEFAAACIDCWQKRVPFGTYNLTNPGAVSTRDVVSLIRKHGLSEKEFHFFDSEREFMQIAAKTPRSNCVLDVAKAQAAGITMSPVHEALEKAMRAWKWAAV